MLSTTINKYCYITCRHLPPFFQHKHRLVYSRIENVREVEDIEHPAVRAVLGWMQLDRGLEIHHDGDLPARSGLGSSSSFTVGLLHALQALSGRMMDRETLANDAIHIEQNVIGESVGSQDQISAAFGGFNRIIFHQNDTFEVSPVILPRQRQRALSDHLMLCFTGVSRIASEIAKSQIKNLENRARELQHMRAMVDEAIIILQDPDQPLTSFGDLLHASWECKRKLSDSVSTPQIDELYNEARRAGAIGGKILGAGGGGFMLLFAKPEVQPEIRARLKHLVHVPFQFEDTGSRVVLYQPNGL